MKCPYCNCTHERPKWCSNYCKFEFYKSQKRLINESSHKSVNLTCKYCNNEFFVRRRLDEIFCSNECKIEFHKSNLKNLTASKRQLTIKRCPVCLLDFTPLKSMKQKYCSRRCCYLFPKKAYGALATCRQYLGTQKQERTFRTLGYSPLELIEHIQKHPSWKLVKDTDWHLDHIFPIIAFIEKGITDIKIICSLTNLQPLSAIDNMKKNDSYDPELFDKWLKQMEL